MAAALRQYYRNDDATYNRELKIFRSCNEKVGKMLAWTNKGEDSIEELRGLAMSQGGLYNGKPRFGFGM